MEILKKRVLKEFNDLSTHQEENNIEVWLVNNYIRHWKAKIKGPVIIIFDYN